MGITREALLWHTQIEQQDNDHAWKEKHEGRLAVSDLGHCVRKAYLRLRKSIETHPHDDYVMGLMRNGNMYQNDTGRALAAWFGDRLLPLDHIMLRVCDDKWLGHLDFLVHNMAGPVIIEHKATNPDNFKRKDQQPDGSKKDRLPYTFHCYQLAGYGHLWQKNMGGPAPHLLLYYRAWDRWGEIELFPNEYGIAWEGEFDGQYRSGMIDTPITSEMAAFEQWWGSKVLPPRCETPLLTPLTCTKTIYHGGTRPSCLYFGVCWPEVQEFNDGTLDVSRWK